MHKERLVKYSVKNPIVWQSFTGQRFNNFEGMTHQHLSNVYYWTHLVNPGWYDDMTKGLIKLSIDKKFDGEILKYRPLACFDLEIRTLKIEAVLSMMITKIK